MKSSAGHAGHTGGQRNESSNHGKQAPEEHSQISPAGKELLCPVQFALAHQDPAAVALDQRTPAVAADLIRYERPEIAANRARCRHPKQIELALENQVASKRHD